MGEALLSAVFQLTLAGSDQKAARKGKLSRWCASALPWRKPEPDVFISPSCSFAGPVVGFSERFIGPKLEFEQRSRKPSSRKPSSPRPGATVHRRSESRHR